MHAKEVFEILVREHASSLMIYLRSMIPDSASAEDLFQETLLTAWKNIDRYDRERPFGPWLRGIAGKLVLVWYRDRQRTPAPLSEKIVELLDARMTALDSLPGDTTDEKIEALQHCLSQLPDLYREMIYLRYHKKMMPGTITESTAVALETVKKRLHRARALLLTCLTRKLGSHGAFS